MNEHFSPLRQLRLIDLASEPPLALGALTIRPAALEVEGFGQVTTLEPRCMQVLVALVRARGEPVSRDEMIERCWEGRIVTEGALNRCVARVRKALAPEPRARVDTIAKIGYRLRLLPVVPAVPIVADEFAHAVASATAADGATPARTGSAKGRPRRLMIAAGVGALAALAGGAWAISSRPATWTAEAIRPLTSEPGLETHPTISLDGRLLVYAAKPDGEDERELYLRGVDQGAPVRLTNDPADDMSPAWSPGQDRIAFVRRTPGPCLIQVMAIPSGAARTAGRCSVSTTTRLSWLDERTVLFSDQPTDNAVRRIRALDVETGQVRDVTSPSSVTYGDSDPAVSPDGRRLLFRRTMSHGIDDLFVLDLRNRMPVGGERALTADGWKAHGSTWASDSRHVFFASNRGGDFGLWIVDTRGGREPRRVSLGASTFSRMSADARNHLAVEVQANRTNLAWLEADGSARPITATTADDWDPDIAADGAVAYISTPTGAPEVWVRTPAGAPTRLTDFRSSYVHGPRWSPDGQRIAFVAVRDRNAEIYTVSRDGAGLRRLTHVSGDKRDVWFTADGRALIYLHRQGDGFAPVRLPLSGSATPQVLTSLGGGWRALRADGEGRFYGVKQGDGRLWALDLERGRASLISGAPTIEPEDVWLVRPEGVYLSRAERNRRAGLSFAPWGQPLRRIRDLPTLYGAPAIAVQAGTERILFAQQLESQADLALIDLKRG
jgi:Tol biopolymer transport system component/DNA-binding winged helix-turn-helix (wHTH) protein